MPHTLAIMFTITTYGMWLRGDRRGWVDDGVTLPPNPALEHYDRTRLPHPPYLFPSDVRLTTARAMAVSLTARLGLTLHALTLQSWHAHFVVAATPHDVGEVSKCAKDAARYHLRPGRPIWGADYDKRFCFDPASVRARVRYVERHNVENHWPPNPFPDLITPYL